MMSEEKSYEFGHEALEADMRHLAQEVLGHRENPEYRGLGDEELLKKSIEKLFPITPHTPIPPEVSRTSPLPDYTDNVSPEMKLEVEYLLDLAFHQGIEKAHALARRSHPFVIDTFHDALVGKLYPELKRRGLL